VKILIAQLRLNVNKVFTIKLNEAIKRKDDTILPGNGAGMEKRIALEAAKQSW